MVAPLTSVFVEVAANRRDFHVERFDSRGYRVVGGMLFEPGPGSRIKGEFFGGYMNQNYNGIGFQTVSTWTYRQRPGVPADAESHRHAGRPARRPRGVAERRPVRRPPGDGVERDRDRRRGPARLGGAAEPRASAPASPICEDEYLGASRTDRAWSPLASLKYFVNRYLTLGFDYRYLSFDSERASACWAITATSICSRPTVQL